MSDDSKLVEALANAMQNAEIRDEEGDMGRLFDLLGFSGENKSRTVVRALATACLPVIQSLSAHPAGDVALREAAREIDAILTIGILNVDGIRLSRAMKALTTALRASTGTPAEGEGV